jgi:hypothetical protein
MKREQSKEVFFVCKKKVKFYFLKNYKDYLEEQKGRRMKFVKMRWHLIMKFMN